MAAPFDWDPFAPDDDSVVRSDELRRRCPVAHSEALGWSLFRHRDVMRALRDHATLSSAVSAHRAVPNGMDPPEHTEYRVSSSHALTSAVTPANVFMLQNHKLFDVPRWMLIARLPLQVVLLALIAWSTNVFGPLRVGAVDQPRAN